MSKLENKFYTLWQSEYNDPVFTLNPQLSIIPGRKFKFDFVHLPSKVAIEINGKIWGKGAHSSGKGLLRDYEKLNLAQMQGYCVFQLSSEMITPQWLSLISEIILSRFSSSSV